MSEIKTHQEWCRNPSMHGSYDDYVRHVRGMDRYLDEQRQERLAEKIATKLAEKLRAQGPQR